MLLSLAPVMQSRDRTRGRNKTLADRLIAWLDPCGYTIVEKDRAHNEATLVPAHTYRSSVA
jgi:hypothetical protein